jgi:3-vinyl bacteriochlorophyllide hydratase
MPEGGQGAMLARRATSVWTKIHPLFALGQLVAFFASCGLLVAYFFGHASLSAVESSALVKIGLMVGAVITGALWEHDVYGAWWFAPEFLIEDTMTVIVFLFQLGYLFVAFVHPTHTSSIIGMLCTAYAIYLFNVAQYVHRTQQAKKQQAELILKQAA